MRLLSITALLLLAVAFVQASTHFVKEENNGVPSGWVQLERASPSQSLELSILIRQRNVAELESTFWAVSDPSSPRYGKHLSLEEVNELVAPSEQHVSQVLQWVAAHGIDTSARKISFTPNKDMIRVICTVAQAEALLHAKYFEFAHKERKGLQLVRTLSYKLPTFLSEIVDTVGPTVRFPSPSSVRLAKSSPTATAAAAITKKSVKTPKAKRAARRSNVKYDCSQGTTPACIKGLYNVNDYVASSTSNTSLAVTGFLEQYISETDLSSFFTAYDPTHARSPIIVGPNVPSNPGVEASLDIQYGMGVAPGVPVTFWYTVGRQPGSTDNEPFLAFLQTISSTAQVPWVISTSYGDNEPTVNFDYASRMNIEFQKMGVRGISVLYSSGDGGVSGGQSEQCTTFIPTYPAGSPFVTSVGASTGQAPETAASFSSGGFTNYWSQPSYQSSAVSAYINNYGASTLPAANLWNQTGRGFPDVSAQGTGFPVYVGGWAQPVDGTSCSSPTFAAIVSLLNDVRFQAGKSSLGFLNPLFYQNPQVFNDVTSGTNPGCGTNGFTATQGWDPVTGLGTPDFGRLASLVKSLP